MIGNRDDGAKACRSTPFTLLAVIPLCGLRRHISLADIVGKRGGVARPRMAATAAARALQQEALAGAHLVAARRRCHKFLRGAEPDDEARAAAGLAALDPAGRKAALVVAADDGGVFQELVFALE